MACYYSKDNLYKRIEEERKFLCAETNMYPLDLVAL